MSVVRRAAGYRDRAARTGAKVVARRTNIVVAERIPPTRQACEVCFIVEIRVEIILYIDTRYKKIRGRRHLRSEALQKPGKLEQLCQFLKFAERF